MPRLVLLLAIALVFPMPARAELILDVLPGDTQASVLIRHSREVRSAAGHGAAGSKRKLAYRLLLRSPVVANAVMHAGDKIVVGPTGLLSLLRTNGKSMLPAIPPQPAAVADCPPAPVCAPPPAPVSVVSADGTHAKIGDVELTAGPDLAFFERADQLHIVGFGATPFDLALPTTAPFSLPANAFVKRLGEGLLVPASLPDDPLPLVTQGRLNVHEDHLHLTAKFERPAWQQLHAARIDGAPSDPSRRQAAAALVVKLLDVHIARAPAEFATSLAHLLVLVDRTWSGFARGLPERELAEMIDLDDGRSVEAGGRLTEAH
jgi:hypothetical protein